MHLPSLLKLCGKQRLLAQGKIIHTHIVSCCEEQGTLLRNLLMYMYGSCGAVEESKSIFHSCDMTSHNLFSFSIMMGSFTKHGYPMDAHCLFHRMLFQGFIPDKVMFVTLISSCSNEEVLSIGKIMHVQMMYCDGLAHMDVIVGTTLITMYNKCGDIQAAKNAFGMVEQRNVISWNALISAYVDHGQLDVALCLFKQMNVEGALPDSVTFLAILPILSTLVDAKQCHAFLIGSYIDPQISIGTSLIHMYGKCHCLEGSLRAFDKLQWRNLVSWNAYINACVHNYNPYTHNHKNAHNSMQLLLQQMKNEGFMPDEVSFLGVLALCRTLAEVKQIHVSILSLGYVTSHLALGAALVKAYSECQSAHDAWVIFDQELECKNIVSWNTILGASIQNGEYDKSLQLFKQLHLECHIPDKVTYTTILSGCADRADQVALAEGVRLHTCLAADGIESHAMNSLINMYAKCGDLKLAWVQFNSNISEQNVVFWNSMICGFLEFGTFSGPFQLSQQMVCQGTLPSPVTYATLFATCANTLALEEGMRLHSGISGGSLEANTVVGNAIIHMYGKCGGLRQATLAFEKIKNRSLITWNALIGAFYQHGHIEDVISILNHMQMEGVDPDGVTFFNVLSACSHCGLLDEGFQYFFMCYSYNVMPCIEHFNCLIGLLGRAGRLDEGEEIIRNMPFAKIASSWMGLLACCNMHLDGIRGKQLADVVFQLEPDNAASYVTLANIYAMGD